MVDKFFSINSCDRCDGSLEKRTMSWFTQETICMICSEKESEIKKKLPVDKNFEGCGYIPDPDNLK